MSRLSIPITGRQINVLVIGVAALTAFVMFALHDPATAWLYPRCLFYATTGWHCPGCGGQRAAHQLIHGHLLTAFFLNPLVTLATPFLAWSFLRYVLQEAFEIRVPGISIRSPYLWLLVGGVLLFFILRNVPVYPLTLFAPNR